MLECLLSSQRHGKNQSNNVLYICFYFFFYHVNNTLFAHEYKDKLDVQEDIINPSKKQEHKVTQRRKKEYSRYSV